MLIDTIDTQHYMMIRLVSTYWVKPATHNNKQSPQMMHIDTFGHSLKTKIKCI